MKIKTAPTTREILPYVQKLIYKLKLGTYDKPKYMDDAQIIHACYQNIKTFMRTIIVR